MIVSFWKGKEFMGYSTYITELSDWRNAFILISNNFSFLFEENESEIFF